MGEDRLLPGGSVYVGVNLGCSDVLMSEHVLDNTKVSSVFDEMSGERVPESMRRNLLVDACEHSLPLDNVEHGDSAERLSETVQEQDVLKFGGCRDRTDGKIFTDCGNRRLPHRNYSFLIALADDTDKGLVKIDA